MNVLLNNQLKFLFYFTILYVMYYDMDVKKDKNWKVKEYQVLGGIEPGPTG